MIKSFRHKGLNRFYRDGETKFLPTEQLEKIKRILSYLEAANRPDSMNMPGFRLHPLKGSHKGFYAVTVAANWRIIFRFEDGNAVDVDYLDYH